MVPPEPFDVVVSAGAVLLLAIGLFLRGRQVEEEEAVPFRSGHFASNRTQGPVDLAVEFETVHDAAARREFLFQLVATA